MSHSNTGSTSILMKIVKKTSYKCYVVKTLPLLLSVNAFNAAAQEPVDLFDLTLEELINIKISVTSNRENTITDSPAIVSRYNREDLEHMGINTLEEMFNFVPGVIVHKSYFGWQSVQVRGIDETFNQKVLFLLNGVPYHQPSHSVIPMHGVPWHSISHIEVIRGPGAVFHGTQASAAVLNVVTKTEEGNTAGYYSDISSFHQGSGYFQTTFDNNASLNIAVDARTQEQQNVEFQQLYSDVGVITDSAGISLNKNSVIAQYRQGSLSVDVQTFNSKTIGLNDGYTDANTLQTLTLDSNGSLIHVNNDWHSENTIISAYTDYNQYSFDLTLGNVFGRGLNLTGSKSDEAHKDYRLRYGVQMSHYLTPQLDLSLGLESETRSVGTYQLFAGNNSNSQPLATILENDTYNESSAYFQADFQWDSYHFLAGGRYTSNEISGEKFTPRYGVIYSIDNHQTVKLLHSTGFNSPNPTQTLINVPGNVIGNKDLTAEVVTATDLAYTYNKNNVLFVANIYRMEAIDFIIRRTNHALNSASYFNEGNYTRTGAEVDLQYAVNNSKAYFNLAYQMDGNEIVATDLDAYRIPKLTASVGLQTTLKQHHKLGGNLNHVSERSGLPAQTIVNVRYSYLFSNAEVFVIAKNIFDETILHPSNDTQLSTLVAPGEKGTELYLGVKTSF